MTYCARYRFKILTPPKMADGESLILNIPGFPPATLDIGQDAHPSGKWAVVRIKGFATEEEALSFGQQLGDALSLVGAVTRLGIDVGFSRSTLQFSKAIQDAIAKTGTQLRTEIHGLMVYEEETVSIMGMDARGSALITPDALQQHLTEWVPVTKGLPNAREIALHC